MIFTTFKNYWNVILKSDYWKPYLLLIIWMFLSSVFNENSKESLNIMISVTATFLLSFSVYSLSQKGANARLISLGFICLFVAILYATVTSGNFHASFDYSSEAERRGNTEMNSNQYAYFSLFAIMAFRILLGNNITRRPLLRVVSYFVWGALAFFVALLTASRQVLILEVPVLLFYLYIDFWKGSTSFKRFGIFLLVIMIIFLYMPQVLDLYNNSYLSVRSNQNLQEDARTYLLLLGFQQGCENPLIGLGYGADVEFTHCTYTHILARCGFPAFILYVYIVLHAIRQQYSRYRETSNNYFFLLLFLCIVFFIANFFYSYINQPYMMTILFLIIGESEKQYLYYHNKLS